VKLYFASEYAANILDPHFKSFPAPLVGDKVEIRKYLEEKAAAGEIAYTALNGGPILDMCQFIQPPCLLKVHKPILFLPKGSTKASRASTSKPAKPRFMAPAMSSPAGPSSPFTRTQ